MDYDARLVQFCPPAYVQMARVTDLTKPPTGTDVLGEAWEQGRGDCINALIAWFTPKINARSDPQQIENWLSYLAGYYDPLPDPLRADVREALLRIGYNRDLAKVYFLALSAHKIDLRKELAQQIKPDWSFPDIKREYAYTWFYYKYLAVMGEPGAYEALAEKVAHTTKGNDVYGMLDDLTELRTSEARAILEQYRNDSRDLIGPRGDKTPLSEIIPTIISITKWQ